MIHICCLAGLSLLGLGCSSQIKNELTIRKASDTYANGQKKFDGKFLECVRNDTYVPELLIFEKKKFGKWTAYNEDGSILESREYTSNVEDCQTAILKQGAWKYYNHEGIHYLTEHYRNDTLMHAEWEMYEGNSPVGTVVKSDIHADSMVYLHDERTGSLLNNASFDQYFFKTIPIVNDGQDQIQSLIPFWYSPDGATPDYYHPYRSIEDVPQHFRQDSTSQELNGQIGLVLFLDALKEKYQASEVSTYAELDYTEAIQSRLNQPLKAGQNYCFRVDIRLSEHAGFSINQFGALLTEEAVSFDKHTTLSHRSISFERPLRNTDHWETLCSTYTAQGGEMYLTLGRLTDVSDTKVIRREPKSKSSLDVNRAAYYLLDHVSLYPIDQLGDCHCNEPALTEEDAQDISWTKIAEGDTLVLHDLHFSFDSDKLETASSDDLSRLLHFLTAYPDQNISIQGHSSDEGTDAYNLDLSYKRAQAVGKWLVGEGIAPERLQFEAYGSSRPISALSQQANRRVEIILLKE